MKRKGLVVMGFVWEVAGGEGSVGGEVMSIVSIVGGGKSRLNVIVAFLEVSSCVRKLCYGAVGEAASIEVGLMGF